MRGLVLAATAVVALAAATPSADVFRSWARSHGRVYTAAEEERRLPVFEQNLMEAERLNAFAGPVAHYEATKFADLTREEFASTYASGIAGSGSTLLKFAITPDNDNGSADYSSYLPPVKDQQKCGSCWAFSAVANAEGQTFLRTGEVVSLSEQQLVSCDNGDGACHGGLMTKADVYIVQNGLASESDYPYGSGSGAVPKCSAVRPVAKFTSAVDLGSVASDAALIQYMAKYGPVSIGISADSAAFQLYSGGVLDSPECGTWVNHGVTLVGYGKDSATGTKYWLVRNSWGADWGEAGYVRIVRGRNMCGINSMVSTIVA